MLQLAANIYAAVNPMTLPGANGIPVPQPPVFDRSFKVISSGGSNQFVFITNFVQDTPLNAYGQIITNTGFKELTDTDDQTQ